MHGLIGSAHGAARRKINIAQPRIAVHDHAAAAGSVDIEPAARKHPGIGAGGNIDAAVLAAQRFRVNIAAARGVGHERPAPPVDPQIGAGR